MFAFKPPLTRHRHQKVQLPRSKDEELEELFQDVNEMVVGLIAEVKMDEEDEGFKVGDREQNNWMLD